MAICESGKSSPPQPHVEQPAKRALFINTGRVLIGASIPPAIVKTMDTWHASESLRYILNPPQEFGEDSSSIRLPAPTSPYQFLTFGDSFIQGYQEEVLDEDGVLVMKRKPEAAAIFEVLGKIKQKNPASPWVWHNNAQPGETTKNMINYRLQPGAIEKDPSNPPTAILLSAGGNDARELLSTYKDDLKNLLVENHIDFSTPAKLVDLARKILAGTVSYEETFEQVVIALLNLRPTINVQQIVIQGLPNMRFSQAAVLSDDTVIPIHGYREREALASSLSILLNNVMVRVQEKLQAKSAVVVPLHFLNIFDLLGPDDFSGMHPNILGQRKIADEYLRRFTVKAMSEELISLAEIDDTQI